MSLTPESRSQVLESIKKLVLKHHINVAGADYDEWTKLIAERKSEFLTIARFSFRDKSVVLLT